MTDILVPFGTRPEIIKLSPVVSALRSAGFAVRTIATNQHFDASLSDTFFEELGLRPDTLWQISGEPHQRLAAMTSRAEQELSDRQPRLVLVLGDTNTVPLFAQAARRHGVPVAHLEAGLRSFNETSVEEVNRRVAAACATLHLPPTELAARFLLGEGIDPQRIHTVGNPVLDVLRLMGVQAKPAQDRSGVVFTAHRASNVDDPGRLAKIVSIVQGLAAFLGPVVFPVHPRTRARLQDTGLLSDLDRDGVELRPPLPYGEMIDLVAHARLVVTDSGGLQEEAAWLRVPTIVLRRSTPRWEGITSGLATLVGLDVELALDVARELAAEQRQSAVAGLDCPYGDGHTSERVASLLADPQVWRNLELREPDFVGQAAPE